jgi:hypothetical protein
MILLAIIFGFGIVAQGVIDRVAVVVGTDVITESEVIREVRLTQFLNGQPLDLSAAERKAAAERLVDQQLIRNEMEVGGYSMPSESEGPAVLRNFRQQNYRSTPAFRAALEKYGLTEDDLQHHLLWQVAALRFADSRFHMAIPAESSNSANRSRDTDGSEKPEDQMDAWLKQARSATRIQFKKEAFQ